MAAHASRFTAHLAALISGALAVVFALALSMPAAAWVVLGLGIVGLVAGLAAFAMPDQGAGARVVEMLLVATGGWTVVASRVFSDAHVTRWLCFASGVALWALGLVGLVVHERLMERRLRRMVEEERYRLVLTRRPDRAESSWQQAER